MLVRAPGGAGVETAGAPTWGPPSTPMPDGLSNNSVEMTLAAFHNADRPRASTRNAPYRIAAARLDPGRQKCVAPSRTGSGSARKGPTAIATWDAPIIDSLRYVNVRQPTPPDDGSAAA